MAIFQYCERTRKTEATLTRLDWLVIASNVVLQEDRSLSVKVNQEELIGSEAAKGASPKDGQGRSLEKPTQ